MEGYLIIGLGRFGKSIAKTLYNHNKTVLGLDIDEEIVQQVIDNEIISEAIVIDATNENELKKIIDDDFGTAFVCIGDNIQVSILVTLILKELGVKTVICKAKTKMQGKVLEKIGASSVVYPEEAMGEKIAFNVLQSNITEYFKFSDKYGIFEFKAPKSFIGKNLMELDLRKKYGINIIVIKSENKEINFTPNPLTVIEENDTLFAMAEQEKMSFLSNII